ncbi:MAG TPA: hypothetical protein VLA49_21160 [Anaerolineales bacterium]|nr:hypothetical protein [Anaerolineales bacterium]
MSYRLSNNKDPDQALRMNNGAWFDILTLAVDYGWNPMGTVRDQWLPGINPGLDRFDLDEEFWSGSYISELGSLVLLDDALNLADALERAFIDYDPQPSRRYLPGYFNGAGEKNGGLRAGVGVILALTDFCRCGAFWVEYLY